MRRGEIALSTNAIVTIVIALVLLVLLVVFVAGSFTHTSGSFMDTAKNSLAPKSSSVEPLKWAFDSPPVQGEQYILRVSVFNAGPAAAGVHLTLACPGGILTGPLEASAKDILAATSMDFQGLGTIDASAPSGNHLCALTATSLNGRVVATSDIVVTLA